MEEKRRTISYLRSSWPEPLPIPATLQQALADCLNVLTDVKATCLPIRDGQAAILNRDVRPDRISLHIAAWTDREPVSTVPHATGAAADLSAEPPGIDWDYLDGDGMILVSGDHFLLMPSGLHPKSMEQYIRKLLEQGREQNAPIPKEMDSFRLIPTANKDAIQQMYAQGVKKIGLNVGQYMETAREREDSGPKTIVERLSSDIWKSLITEEEDRRRIEEADNVSAQLVIKVNTRRRGLSLGDLVPIAQEIAEESEDDVVIETGGGQRIQRGDLVCKKTVKVTADAKTVSYTDAWEAMAEWFRELKESGVLEE